MHPLSQFDYLIIGQGLAGSILAYELINNGSRVMVLDNDHQASSSVVAAGIINPITGHRLNISDNFEQLMPAAQRFYQRLEASLGVSLYREISQLRLIKNQGQLDYFRKRTTEDEYRHLLADLDSSPVSFPNAEFGAAEISQTAILDTGALLVSLRQWLINQHSYKQCKLDYSALNFVQNSVKLGSLESKKIIFCEGFQAIRNPWLKHLPFKLAKGEIIDVHIEGGLPSSMLNWGNWLVPCDHAEQNSGIARLGSNFVWNDLSLTPNKATQKKLLSGLLEHTGIRAHTVQSNVGIRPTTAQRKPFIGPICQPDNAYCFNGFGSKGCLLIPHYAKLLSQHFEHHQPLPTYLTQFLTN